MTPEQINQRIAEKCGWEYHPSKHWSEIWKDPLGNWHETCPKFNGDLNACHEMEKILTYEQLIEYTRNIGLVHTQTTNQNDWRFWGFVHIPPNERCEAFLRTVGGWEE